MRYYNIPIFIPELACPHRCVFCNQNRISGATDIPSPGEVPGIVETKLQYMAPDSHINIAFFGGSFTGIPTEQQQEYLQAAQRFIESGRVQGIRISTRPDYIDTEILEMLKTYKVTCVELGAQSFDSEVLQRSERGHTAEDIIRASQLIKEYDIELGLQMMIGLPGDTRAKAIMTARQIIGCKASNTRIYPALVIRDTPMEQLYNAGEYTPLTLEEAIDWTKDILPVFESNGVQVLRVGLHPSEELISETSLVAGPFHVSFKELVLSAIWRDRFDEGLPQKPGKLTVRVAQSQLSNAVGYHSSNKNYLKEKYGWIQIKADPSLEKYEFYADYN